MFDRKDTSAQSLKELLNKLVEINAWEENISFGKLTLNWEQIVGSGIASHAVPKKLVEGVLHIKTDSSTWRAEILIRQEEIIDKISLFLSKNIVTSLKIR